MCVYIAACAQLVCMCRCVCAGPNFSSLFSIDGNQMLRAVHCSGACLVFKTAPWKTHRNKSEWFPITCFLEGSDLVQSKEAWASAVQASKEVTRKLAAAGVVDDNMWLDEEEEVSECTVEKVRYV